MELELPPKTCAHGPCGKQFKPTRRFQKYCSTRCQANAAWQRRNGGSQLRNCKVCGQEFWRGPERWAYCSSVCRTIAQRAYWKSDHGRSVKRAWYRRRQDALKEEKNLSPRWSSPAKASGPSAESPTLARRLCRGRGRRLTSAACGDSPPENQLYQPCRDVKTGEPDRTCVVDHAKSDLEVQICNVGHDESTRHAWLVPGLNVSVFSQ